MEEKERKEKEEKLFFRGGYLRQKREWKKKKKKRIKGKPKLFLSAHHPSLIVLHTGCTTPSFHPYSPGESREGRFIFFPKQVLALGTYVLCGLLSPASFVVNFVVIVIVLSVDFWVTKNITGRMLVGLRYWNETGDDGTSTWKFESKEAQGGPTNNKADARVFWGALYAFPACWVIMALLALLRFDILYLLVCVTALAFAIPNVVGFTKCSREAKKSLQSVASNASRLGLNPQRLFSSSSSSQ